MKHIKGIILAAITGILLCYLVLYWYEEGKLTFSVKGQVMDSEGKPVPSATVVASLGLDNDGSPSITSPGGQFEVKATSGRWYKGPPLISVTKEGFCMHVVHFKPWKFGDRNAEVKVYLKPGPVTAVTYSKY